MPAQGKAKKAKRPPKKPVTKTGAVSKCGPARKSDPAACKMKRLAGKACATSKSGLPQTETNPVAAIARNLSNRLIALHKSVGGRPTKPIAGVLNSHQYAFCPFGEYCNMFAPAGQQPLALFVGMNPGPYGTAQNGIPFGCSSFVNNWMGITQGTAGSAAVKGTELKEGIDGHGFEYCPAVLGLRCKKEEVSGKRLWGWAQSVVGGGKAEAFFRHAFVYTYCPLAFFAGGANVPLADLPVAERRTIEEHCDQALLALVLEMKPVYVIGVGNYAYSKAEKAVTKAAVESCSPHSMVALKVAHPSPASPGAAAFWQPFTKEDGTADEKDDFATTITAVLHRDAPKLCHAFEMERAKNKSEPSSTVWPANSLSAEVPKSRQLL